MLACDVVQWFRAKSIHAVADADVIRFRLAQLAAAEFLNPPKRQAR